MMAKAQSCREALFEQFEAVRLFNISANLGLSISLVADFGEDWYILAKHKGHNAPALDFLEAALTQHTPAGFVVQRNDNNLTLSPDFLDKAHAVEFVVDRYFDAEKDVFLGMGDSMSDFNFMSSCDFLMLPSNSQLHKAWPRNQER